MEVLAAANLLLLDRLKLVCSAALRPMSASEKGQSI